ncbi:VOC family protein [Salegentibacter sp. JZCK2]|uniref:VOC family protein n=1 Tax=Salegentibacter tibetensis TaxID=2873600 RepID=UPI001CCF0847|nr:VOC family protein [Salegentibacter tibetensis]MBZ9729242.1 VOC family protein [Salegentibacter tibetensis]
MKKSFTFTLIVSFLFLFTFSSKAQELNLRPTIDHIAIYVVDLDKSTNFYENILGLKKISEPFNDGKHTWFALGSNVQLHLIEGASALKEPDKNSHLSFSVSSVSSFITVLKKNKIGYENWLGEKQAITNRVDGVKQIYITDPDGYWLEINDAQQ